MQQWPMQDLEPLFFQVLTAAGWHALASAACSTVTTILTAISHRAQIKTPVYAMKN